MNGDIALIPRAGCRMGRAQRQEWAKKKAEEELKNAVQDPVIVKKTASLYEKHIEKERIRMGLCK